MAFTLQQAITSARDRGGAFHKSRVTDAVCARFLSEYQNSLIGKALQRDRRYLLQSASIVLALSNANTPGTAGAGTTGGLPGAVDDAGAPSVVQATVGALVEARVTSDDGASVVVAERGVTSATSTTTTSTSAARTVNGDVGRLVVIVAGKGQGQSREVTSNTADTWTHAAWTTVPDTTSRIEIVAPVLAVDETSLVATALPATDTQTGYLVKVTAAGVPYIDYTTPLTASVDRGVPLPSVQAIVGGAIRWSDGDAEPLRFATYQTRYDVLSPAVYLSGETLMLCGETADWTDVTSLEVHYVPIAPALTALTDTLLLPDAAKPCVVAQLAAFMAMRVEGMEDVTINTDPYYAMAERAEADYLAALGLSRRARTLTMREDF